MNPSIRQGVGFAVRLGVAYALLTLLWLGLEATYGRAYRAVMQRLFGSFGAGRRVRFAELEASSSWADVEIRLGHVADPSRYFVQEASSFLDGYLPTAVFLALILATPSRMTHWWRAAAALAAVQAYAILRVYLVVASAYASPRLPTEVQLPLSPAVRALLQNSAELLVAETTTTFVVAGLAWFVVLKWPGGLGEDRRSNR